MDEVKRIKSSEFQEFKEKVDKVLDQLRNKKLMIENRLNGIDAQILSAKQLLERTKGSDADDV